MSLGKLVGNLIKKLPSNASKKVKEYFKKNEVTVEDNTLKKYFKKSSKELLQLINNGKINNVEFAFLLMQKLNNYLGENKDEILKKSSGLAIDYKNFFTKTLPDAGTEKIYYNKYKRMKEDIKKIKNQIEKDKNKDTKKKWVRAYPNKLIKQSVSLLGKHKLAASAKIKSRTLKEMAEKNKLTVPDFRNILKYKLSKFFGDIAEQIYEKSKYRDMFHDGLKTFYENFDFDKSTRNKQIQDIYNDYLAIKKAINDQKTITLEYEAGGDGTSGRHKEFCTITLGKYSDFKNNLIKQKDNFASLAEKVKNSNQKVKKWFYDLRNQITSEKDINHFEEQYEELKLKDSVLKLPNFYKSFTELWNDFLKNDKNYEYSFNMFKLLKNNVQKKENLPQTPLSFFYLTIFFTIIQQINDIMNIEKDDELYISISTKKQTENLIKDLIKKNNTENQTDNLTIKERAANLEAMLKGKSTTNKTIKNESPTIIEYDSKDKKYKEIYSNVLDEIKNRKAKLKAEKEKQKKKEEEIEEIQEFEEFLDNSDATDFEEESSDDINDIIEYENDEIEEQEKTKTTKKRGFFGSLKHEVSKVASNAKNNLKSKFKKKKSKK